MSDEDEQLELIEIDVRRDEWEKMARDAARLWKSCTSGDAIGEGEFTELEYLTDECSSMVKGPQLASCASSRCAWWLWAACTPRVRGQPTGRPATVPPSSPILLPLAIFQLLQRRSA